MPLDRLAFLDTFGAGLSAFGMAKSIRTNIEENGFALIG